MGASDGVDGGPAKGLVGAAAAAAVLAGTRLPLQGTGSVGLLVITPGHTLHTGLCNSQSPALHALSGACAGALLAG